MAWTTPPTFVNGAVLSAAQMNILSDDIEYLRGFVSGANPGVPEVTITDNGDIYFLIRHLFQYLHLRVTATP